MTCGKCDDVHVAQRSGKTQDECKCGCHKQTTSPISPWINEPNPLYIPCVQPIITSACCPCTDPSNFGKAMGLVCNCTCHGSTFCVNTKDNTSFGQGPTLTCTSNNPNEYDINFDFNNIDCKTHEATTRGPQQQ